MTITLSICAVLLTLYICFVLGSVASYIRAKAKQIEAVTSRFETTKEDSKTTRLPSFVRGANGKTRYQA